MATVETYPVPAEPRVDWAPVLAGAVGAASLALVLSAFGASVGLSMTSPWPGTGLSLIAVAIFVTYWTVMVQVLSFAAGGYLAGRLRTSAVRATESDITFRDGAHGFLVWAVGVLFMALAMAATGGAVLRSGSTIASGAAAGTGAASAARPGPADYAVDLLLRPAAPSPTATTPAISNPGAANDDTALRSEANRIFASTIRNRELTLRDRDYLAQVVTSRTGLPAADAQRRVTEAVNEARDLEIKVREQADKARKAAIFAGFTAAASLMISLAAACAGATFGGRHRDENKSLEFFGRPIW
jgi:hypothetical protein